MLFGNGFVPGSKWVATIDKGRRQRVNRVAGCSGMQVLAGLYCSAIVASFACAAPAIAQTAGQLAQPTYLPPAERNAPRLVIPEGVPTPAPPGADAIEVRLSGVEIEGAAGADAGPDIAALKVELSGKRVSLATIFDAARRLEMRFARRGRVLVRVVVPAQELAEGGSVRIVIVDGFVAATDTSAVPSKVRLRTSQLLAPLIGVRGIAFGSLERQLLLAADIPGVQLQSMLRPGKAAGATTLVVSATQRPVSGLVSFDNSLSDALGRNVVGLGLNLNSVIGLGELIYLRASGFAGTGDDTGVLTATPRNRALAGGVLLPVGDDGLTINVEATDARTTPRHETADPGFASRFQRVSARLRYPFVRSRTLTIGAQFSIDASDELDRVIVPFEERLAHDRLRVVRLGGDIDLLLPKGGQFYASASLSLGVNAFGARSAADATPDEPLSRQGGDADFQTFNVSASIKQPVAEHVTLALRAAAQTSFGQAVLNAEQFGIAGPNAISSLDASTVQGDGGYFVRGEVQFPFSRTGKTAFGLVTPYAFGAYGVVGLHRPTAVERRVVEATAFGAGGRLLIAPRGSLASLSLSLEYARGNRDDGGGTTDRFNISLLTQF